jgi:hypothetical protein
VSESEIKKIKRMGEGEVEWERTRLKKGGMGEGEWERVRLKKIIKKNGRRRRRVRGKENKKIKK